MDVTPPRPSRLSERKRRAILSAAIDEFRQSGYEATRMDQIAARAGVSKRTVYNHFPGKDVLFAQTLQHLWQSLIGDESLPWRDDRSLREQLLALVQQKFRLINDEAFVALARVALTASLHTPDQARDMADRINAREEGLTRWIRAATEAGRLRVDDPVFASHQLHCLIKGFAFYPQLTLGKPPLDAEQQRKVAESAVDMFLDHYAVR